MERGVRMVQHMPLSFHSHKMVLVQHMCLSFLRRRRMVGRGSTVGMQVKKHVCIGVCVNSMCLLQAQNGGMRHWHGQAGEEACVHCGVCQ